MRHAAADQGFQLRGADQVSVEGAGQVVLPLHPDGHFLVGHGQRLQLQRSHLGHQLLLFLLLFGDRLEAVQVVLADRKSKQKRVGLEFLATRAAYQTVPEDVSELAQG